MLKTKSQPLDLEVEHIFVNDLAEATINMIIQGLTTKEQIVDSKEEAITLIFDLVQEIVNAEIKQCLKSACEFYLRYEDNPSLLAKEHPKLRQKLYECVPKAWIESMEPDELYDWKDYNDWLFKLVFKDVLGVEKVKDKPNMSDWDNPRVRSEYIEKI